MYCDVEDDDDDFDDTCINADDVDLEEEDADVGVAKEGDRAEVGEVPAPEAAGDDHVFPVAALLVAIGRPISEPATSSVRTRSCRHNDGVP